MRARIEQATLLLDTIGVWGLYLAFYLVVFSALTISAYATAQHVFLGD